MYAAQRSGTSSSGLEEISTIPEGTIMLLHTRTAETQMARAARVADQEVLE